MIITWEHLSQLEQLWVNRSLDKKTLNIIESFWFHLVEIETIWETGQLTTKTCNWDSLIFFWVILISFLFGCWLFGNVVSSNLRHLQSAPSFIPASCSKPVKLHTESVRNISRFQHLKMASQFLWKNCREDSVSFGLFRVAFECSASMFETFWMFLRLKKLFKMLHFLKAICSPSADSLWRGHVCAVSGIKNAARESTSNERPALTDTVRTPSVASLLGEWLRT